MLLWGLYLSSFGVAFSIYYNTVSPLLVALSKIPEFVSITLFLKNQNIVDAQYFLGLLQN
jgi:hypothetical protein